jgi:hypothetical protein
MEGWDVVTVDGDKLGRVVAEVDEYLIVEGGHLIKSRHPVPRAFSHLREDEQQVCLSVPKEVLHDAPKADKDNEFDRRAAAEYYGLAESMPDAPAEGYGESLPDDPARTADQDADISGQLAAEEERARIRTRKHHDRVPSSPGLLGERKRDLGS